MSALGQKQTFAVHKVHVRFTPKADMCGATRNVRFVPKVDNQLSTKFIRALPCEQEIVERLGSRRHTFELRAKNIGVGGQHFDIDCSVDLITSRRHHSSVGRRNDAAI